MENLNFDVSPVFPQQIKQKNDVLLKHNIPYIKLSDDLLNEELLPNGKLYIV